MELGKGLGVLIYALFSPYMIIKMSLGKKILAKLANKN